MNLTSRIQRKKMKSLDLVVTTTLKFGLQYYIMDTRQTVTESFAINPSWLQTERWRTEECWTIYFFSDTQRRWNSCEISVFTKFNCSTSNKEKITHFALVVSSSYNWSLYLETNFEVHPSATRTCIRFAFTTEAKIWLFHLKVVYSWWTKCHYEILSRCPKDTDLTSGYFPNHSKTILSLRIKTFNVSKKWYSWCSFLCTYLIWI